MSHDERKTKQKIKEIKNYEHFIITGTHSLFAYFFDTFLSRISSKKVRTKFFSSLIDLIFSTLKSSSF